jgi:hypothetical protein
VAQTGLIIWEVVDNPIEYEHDSPKLMEEVAVCAAFVEKTAQSF